MVPTARLELAQLSPLPPQDSVSTNFTTSARVLRMLLTTDKVFLIALAGAFFNHCVEVKPQFLHWLH